MKHGGLWKHQAAGHPPCGDKAPPLPRSTAATSTAAAVMNTQRIATTTSFEDPFCGDQIHVAVDLQLDSFEGGLTSLSMLRWIAICFLPRWPFA